MFTGYIPADDELRPYAVPLKPKPYRHNVGLRPTQRWLLPGSDSPGQLARKRQLWAMRGEELVAVLPEDEAIAATMRAAAAVAHAAGLDVNEVSLVVPDDELATSGGSTEGDNLTRVGKARAALAGVAASISEDICVMSRHAGSWQLVSLAVFFPSHWSPLSKVGGGLDVIHTPVPDYGRIANATEQAFERLAGSQGVWERFNWTLTPDAELCHTASATDGVGVTEPPESAEDLWLRVERQTLAALDSDLLVFLIRTFLTPLPELQASERQALEEAISGVSDELAEYRSWLGYREAVSRWVQGQ